MAMQLGEKSTLVDPQQWELRRGTIVVRHIRGQQAGPGRFHEGPRNEITPSLEDLDLERLKDRIRTQSSW